MCLYSVNSPPYIPLNVNYVSNSQFRIRLSTQTRVNIQVSSLLKSNRNENLPESQKIPENSKQPKSLLSQPNTIGIIGGVSPFSTLIFLEKLVWWSLKEGSKESIPFVVCSDPTLSRELKNWDSRVCHNRLQIKDTLMCKKAFLECSGARFIVMPCHILHMWHEEVFGIRSLNFLHVGDCVAREIKEAELKPIEAGSSSVRIGVLAMDRTMIAGFYQEKLQNQGFEVMLLDKPTMEHIITPAIEARSRKDMEGARNLLRIAIHVLLVRGVSIVIIALDELQGLLPRDDPLHRKCIYPMDALARAAIKWSKSATENVHEDS